MVPKDENPEFSLEDFLGLSDSVEANPVKTQEEIDSEILADMEKGEKELAQEKINQGKAMQDTMQERMNAEQAEIDELARQIHELRMKQREHEEKKNEIGQESWTAQRLINEGRQELRRIDAEKTRIELEEKHKAEEAAREAAILSRKQIAMAGFKSTIDHINPAWKDYAFDHQWEGASSLALHNGGLLADDMGLGKSLTAIMFADMVEAKRILVVTPSATATNFTLEWGMWANHRFIWTLANNSKAARHAFVDGILTPRAMAGEDMTLVINYEQLYTDDAFVAKLRALNFDLIIVDEFHNAKDKRSLLFKQLVKFRDSGCKRFLPVTGTFILNSPKDIWTALHLVDPQAFPGEAQFLNSYCRKDYYNDKWTFRQGGERAMLKALGGRIVKRNLEEAGIVLPKQEFHEIDVPWSEEYAEQRKILKQLTEHSQIILDANTKMSVTAQIALYTRQRQGVVWPAGIELKDPETGAVVFSVKDFVSNSIKVDWVFNKAMKLMNEGKRITVFSQFKTGLAELERKFTEAGKRVVRYDGDTPNDIKSRVKRDFDRRHVELNNGEYEWDIAVCNFKVGGVGLNFTHATEMILLDEEWNPGKNEQAYKRQRRIGQTEETNVWIPRVEKSIDQWMQKLNEQKRRIIDGFNEEVDLSKDLNSFFVDMLKE